jgi:uncharacterized protein
VTGRVKAGPAVRFAVRLTPRAGASRIDGVRDGSLRVRVTAPPVDGAANAALIALIADALGVPRGSVRVALGSGSRDKLVAVDGVSPSRLAAAWPSLSPPPGPPRPPGRRRPSPRDGAGA